MRKYTHLSLEEREEIFALLQSGKKKNEIGEILNRDPSTIGREIERNKTMIGIKNNNNPPAKKDPEKYHYLPDRAQGKYMERRKESKQLCPLKTLDLYKYTLEKLKTRWSPETISGRAKLEDIGDISHECIYQFIYLRASKELKLWQYLARSHKKRRKWHGRKEKRTLIPNRVGIENRPKSVEDRKEFGHWEGDTVIGKGNNHGLHTAYERLSSYYVLEPMEDLTRRSSILAQLEIYSPLPDGARESTTLDNGMEHVAHTRLRQELRMNTYFTDSYAAWQRGGNENGNLWLRYYFPKGTDFSKISYEELKAVEWELNDRPRKRLGFKKPREVFEECLKGCNR